MEILRSELKPIKIIYLYYKIIYYIFFKQIINFRSFIVLFNFITTRLKNLKVTNNTKNRLLENSRKESVKLFQTSSKLKGHTPAL